MSCNKLTEKTSASLSPIQNKSKSIKYPIENTSYSFELYASMQPIAAHWDSIAPKDNLFLQSDYLGLLERYAPEGMRFRFLLVYNQDEKLVGLLYTQFFHISAEESINEEEDEKNTACIIHSIRKAIKKWMLRRASFDVLICGNLLLTGEHGFYFCPSIDHKEALDVAHNGLETLRQLWEKEFSKIHLVLFKDFQPNTVFPTKEHLVDKYSYIDVPMQPSMKIYLPPAWKTDEDYLASMSSKYRMRAKRALKKGKALITRELSLEEIKSHQERIFELYKGIADNAGVNTFVLHQHYFTALKEHLGDRFNLVGYFLEDKLVAFSTTILNNKELEAHFLGVDENYNRTHQIYLNILYDLVRQGIYNQVEVIDFARTALEIKSSVGAIAHETSCYIRHRNRLSSAILNLIVKRISPTENWKPRHPFKQALPIPQKYQ